MLILYQEIMIIKGIKSTRYNINNFQHTQNHKFRRQYLAMTHQTVTQISMYYYVLLFPLMHMRNVLLS